MIPRRPLIVVATGTLSIFAYGGGAAGGRAFAGDTGSGAISGKVSFSGEIPPTQRVKLSADPKCAALHKDGLERQPVKVKDGGLADVLVYVKSGISAPYAPPAEPFLLDQIGCEYRPGMIVVMVGQPIRIRNSDDTLHNIHPRPTVNKEFNIGQPRQGMEVTRTFDKPELMIPTSCEVHPWMRVYISVLPHPFFSLSKEDGSYEIKGLPDGEYDVEAIHSQLKSATAKIIVKDGRTSRLDFSFKN
jgi:hypothetical protein